MWFRQYRDYPIDRSFKKEKVESGHGIIGCEMHELNGWGTNLHHVKPRKGLVHLLLSFLLRE